MDETFGHGEHVFSRKTHYKLLALICIFSLNGCLNNAGTDSKSTKTASSVGTSNSGTLPTGSNEGFITITKAIRSNQDPDSLIELIGSNGEIGTQCAKLEDCECTFSWTNASGVLREIPQAPAHTETNMMRCMITQVDSDATYYDVKIHIKTGDLYSNALRVFVSSISPSLDSSLASNYLQVQRFMCRDMWNTNSNSNWYTGLLDPRLWGPYYSNTYNFHTTSFGKDYGATAVSTSDGAQVQPTGYECPTIPNDPSAEGYDYSLESLAALDISNPNRNNVLDSQGDKTIYPSDDNKNLAASRCPTGKEATCEKFFANRHDFYLATFRNGIFKEPVCLIHKVGNYVQGGLGCNFDTDKGLVTLGSKAVEDHGKDIIGFAAVPDTNQSCPNTSLAKIPDGKKWGKVWQFRASLVRRALKDDITNKPDVGQLFCTTPEKECVSNARADIDTGIPGLNDDTPSVCNFSAPNGGTSTGGIGPQQVPLGYGNCSSTGTAGAGEGENFNAGSINYLGTACSNNAESPSLPGDQLGSFTCCLDVNFWGKENSTVKNSVSNLTRPANHTSGGDYCTPTLQGSIKALNQNGTDVWLMGNGNKRACIEADTNNQGVMINSSFPPPALGSALPVFNLSSRYLETDSRFDRVYIITPESVTIEQMQDPENNPVAKKYFPKRKLPNGTIVNYELELGTEFIPGETPRQSKFPLCILQDAKQGASQ